MIDIIFAANNKNLITMKKVLTIMIMLACLVSATAQENNTASEIKEIQDKMALKELVDTFSVLADRKDTEAQKDLFTTDAVVDSYVGDQKGMSLVGRENIGSAFAAYLKLFDTVYHQNGQQTVTLNGDTAKGISYCLVVLIGKNPEGKRTMTTQGVWYEDEFVRHDGKWLINHRTSHFTWRTEQEL